MKNDSTSKRIDLAQRTWHRVIVAGLATAAICFAILGWIGYWVPIYEHIKLNDRLHAYFYTSEGLARFYWLRGEEGFYIDTPDNYVNLTIRRSRDRSVWQQTVHARPNAIDTMAVLGLQSPREQRVQELRRRRAARVAVQRGGTMPTSFVQTYGVRTWISLPIALLAAYPIFVITRSSRRRFVEKKRRKAGQCEQCGYNLTGLTKPRCPECGVRLPMSQDGGTMKANQLVLTSAIARFREQKTMAERAVGQLSLEQLRESLDPNTNSVAVIMKHMAGNMRSRWTDFLTTDGEKPWRKRDGEFVDTFESREALIEYWEGGWACLFAALDSLSVDDAGKTVLIRGKPHTVIEAILRQLDHYGYHVGQIVLTARILAQDKWETLTVPRGGSECYNERVWDLSGESRNVR